MTSLSSPTVPDTSGRVRGLSGLHRRTAHEAAREELRHAILSGELAPSTPLILNELAEQLGISRTPVREAIREGLAALPTWASDDLGLRGLTVLPPSAYVRPLPPAPLVEEQAPA